MYTCTYTHIFKCDVNVVVLNGAYQMYSFYVIFSQDYKDLSKKFIHHTWLEYKYSNAVCQYLKVGWECLTDLFLDRGTYFFFFFCSCAQVSGICGNCDLIITTFFNDAPVFVWHGMCV